MRILLTYKGSASSGWYAPPKGTHSGEKHRSVGSGRATKCKVPSITEKKFGSSKPTSSSELGEDQEGVNEAVILEFADGTKGIFKPGDGMHYGSPESEVLMYEFSKSIGWDIVPETVMHEHEGKIGSLQKWVDDCDVGTDVLDTLGVSDLFTLMDDLPTASTRRDAQRMYVMDGLLNNQDRHSGNWLMQKDGKKIWAIDNGVAFGHFLGLKGAGRKYKPRLQKYGTAMDEVMSWTETSDGKDFLDKVADTYGVDDAAKFTAAVEMWRW